jgi:hypothetical protein
MYFAKLAAAEKPEALNAYSPWQLQRAAYGNTPAARGYYILNAFDRNRQAASGISGIYDPARDRERFRPTSVAFYSGRIFYLMPDGKLYFSQVLTNISNADKCYQEADPTAEDINEVVATDGGELDITGIAQGFKLLPIRNELIVFADNGVWSVSGSGDNSFSATSQGVRKITDTGAIGRYAVVSADGTVFYWSEGGIYVLSQDEATGYLYSQNISERTIQKLYLEIPEVGKKNAKAFFDKQSKKIFWLYNDSENYDGIAYKNRYNKALVFDTVLNAFYLYSMPSGDVYIADVFQKSPNAYISIEETVTNAGEVVTDDGDPVTAKIRIRTASEIKLKFLTFAYLEDWVYTVSELKSDTLRDFITYDGEGTPFNSFLETGHDILEDIISEKEANTVYVFMKRTEKDVIAQDVFDSEGDSLVSSNPSSCLMRAKWHWSDSEASGRWSQPQQVYRLQRNWIPSGPGVFDYGFDVIQTINQVRGKGRALSILFQSDGDKDFHLLGWAIPYTIMTGA